MGGSMSAIVPGIYVGGLSSAKSEAQLDTFKITHVCTALHYPITVDHKRLHKQFLLRDALDEDIYKYFVTSSEFIHSGRCDHGSVLIHCACGISRSVTLTLAYLLCVTDFNLRELYKAMRAARIGACPNTSFLQQLVRFEESGAHRKAREFLFAKFGPWPVEKAAADASEIRRLVAIQDAFISTGYYPGDVAAPTIVTTGNGDTYPKPTAFTCRLPDSMRTLDEALATSSSQTCEYGSENPPLDELSP